MIEVVMKVKGTERTFSQKKAVCDLKDVCLCMEDPIIQAWKLEAEREFAKISPDEAPEKTEMKFKMVWEND